MSGRDTGDECKCGCQADVPAVARETAPPTRPYTADEAITFALRIPDTFEMREFLTLYLHGGWRAMEEFEREDYDGRKFVRMTFKDWVRARGSTGERGTVTP